MEIEIQNKDFDGLLYSVNLLKENTNPLKVFPKLRKWPEFRSCKDPVIKFNKIFKWIVLTYDMNSPFKKIDDVIKRKLEVAKYVKLFDDNANIPEDVRKILLNEDKKVNRMIIAYARMHRESKYSLILGLEHKFYEDLLANQNGSTTIKPPLENTQRNLENAITDLLNQDHNTLLKHEFYEYIEDERLDNIRPEGIAQLLADGKVPVTEEEITD